MQIKSSLFLVVDRFCGGENTQKQQTSQRFNEERANNSIKISYELQDSIDFNNR